MGVVYFTLFKTIILTPTGDFIAYGDPSDQIFRPKIKKTAFIKAAFFKKKFGELFIF